MKLFIDLKAIIHKKNIIGNIFFSSQTLPKSKINKIFNLLMFREMVADGVWRQNDGTNYTTCDDYDGKNTPKRIGFNIKKYFNKESVETPTYGPITINSNGFSFMEFNMQLSAIGVREGSSDKSIALGSWKAGYENNLTLLNVQVMKNYTADVVYRVVTVEVITEN